ncbi:MAG: glycosyltransferase family 4 protein [Candidatus Eisenbacteria bacterium]|uniref:Glycosyltransferase family 4 protein n=1 Tax=Eiseniibacteriota bacterium TaxID=2212470 RepID=A0A538U6M1_UNCEI|nr:MAG: glycosyltransferase family 4 protein [Candidatus Eisenbacteria bacterium]
MRIAYLSTDFGVPVHGTKGASIHVREMVRALAASGHEVTIFSPALEPGGAPADLGGAACVEVPPDPTHTAALADLGRAEERAGLSSPLRQELRNLLYSGPFAQRVLEHLQGGPVDLVYERYSLFGHAGGAIARAVGVPHLLEVNAPLAEERRRSRGLCLEALARSSERRVWASADALIVVSRALRDLALEAGVPPERVHVMPNGVDPDRFEDPARLERLPIEARRRLKGAAVIGFLGSLKPWHGVEALIEAFASIHRRRPATHLLIVGDGPLRETLECQVDRLGVSGAVTFSGAIAYDDVPAWLAPMDVTAAPYRDQEGFYFSPIKVFEYLAAGRAVVAGAAGQNAELLRHEETALLVPPGDAVRLESAIERLIEDPALRERLARNGREWVRRERTWAGNAARVTALGDDLRRNRVRTTGASGKALLP